MTKNYKIIQDEEKFRQFINWLPELKENEIFYGCLFARKKYDTTGILKSDKSQLKRFTSTKDFLFTKVKQLECEIGTYTFEGKPIPQNTLAFYMMPNPRDLEKATRLSLIEFAHMIAGANKKYKNPYKAALTSIQKSSSHKIFMDFDFDGEHNDPKIKEIENKIFNLFDRNSFEILYTRGGFHLLVKTKYIDESIKKFWYKTVISWGCDACGDNLIPVPGCCQGDWIPYFK